MSRSTTPPSHHRWQALLGLVVGTLVFAAFVHRPRARVPDNLPTRPIAPAPTAAVLLASVAGEEDPGAAVDAPAPPPPRSSTG